jgi:hypothetical protein
VKSSEYYDQRSIDCSVSMSRGNTTGSASAITIWAHITICDSTYWH